eukprot:172716-Hanusia_phi.AAC.1
MVIQRHNPGEMAARRMQRSRNISSTHLLPYCWPGELNETGMRHDNDFADITQIRIIPTLQELLSEQPPCLPQNRADAPHHLPPASIERLIDVHFRLFRHDSMASLAELMRHISGNKAAVLELFNSQKGSDKLRLS